MWADVDSRLSAEPWYPGPNDTLRGLLRDWFNEVESLSTALADTLHQRSGDAPEFWRAASASVFIRTAACRDPQAAVAALDPAPGLASLDGHALRALADNDADTDVDEQLRRARRARFLTIAWRDAADRVSLPEVLEALTEFADISLQVALRTARRRMHRRYGVLRDAAGDEVPLWVFAMGKLGGRELNFSSDIDVIFVYPAEGTSDGERPLQAAEYCLREARHVIDLLDRPTEIGRVFRVDTRLRPFGSSGPLAISLDALELYFQRHGRDWERYAFVKARLLGAGSTVEAELGPVARRFRSDCLQPFVYRGYLDFGVLKALRDMRETLEREAAGSALSDDLKRGPGGIREIEFIVQSWQLIRGGQLPALRTASLESALVSLSRAECLPSALADTLRTSYRFLRRLENRLQALADRQTHALPESPDERAALTRAMGEQDWAALLDVLERHRAPVTHTFRSLVLAGKSAVDEEIAVDWLALTEAAACHTLQAKGVEPAAALAGRIGEFAARMARLPLTGEARGRIDRYVASVIDRLEGFEHRERTLGRALQLAEAVCRRSAYLSLLIEQPQALDRLLRLLAASQFLTEQIVEQPMVLDELLDASVFAEPPDIDGLRAELVRAVADQPTSDPEVATAALVRFVRTAQFRIAVADVGGVLPVMRVSDRLSDTATVVLERTLELAWDDLVRRHGEPAGTALSRPRFAVVAYGKLGGLELGYGSDLDIVFVHDLLPGVTAGPAAIDHDVFVLRLARRIVHFLSVQTRHGRLYEVDMRLRPSGRSGLLVSSLSAFERYQREDAWTWEHQALTRARAVAGDPEVCAAFEQTRARTLVECVRRDTLREDVRQMRERMRENLSTAGPDEFDLKQDRGGIADLEFLVQYLVLRHAGQHPDLVRWSDNVRQLDSLAALGVLSASEAEALQQDYVALRSTVHRLALDGRPARVPVASHSEPRARIAALWSQWMESP